MSRILDDMVKGLQLLETKQKTRAREINRELQCEHAFKARENELEILEQWKGIEVPDKLKAPQRSL